jgi:hypothetical protein
MDFGRATNTYIMAEPLFVMSSVVETSLTITLLKIRDSSTALGMTKKALNRSEP